jgi:DNA-binding beta-propeller fold protein YncE
MRLRNSFVFGLGLAATLALAIGGPRLGAQAGQYTQIGDVLIGGPQAASWDYLNVDTVNKKLYVSHSVEFVVIDLATEKVINKITGIQGGHGIAFAPNGHGFISGGREGKVTVTDLKTYATLAKIDAVNPDAVMYEPKQKEIYAFSNAGSLATVINADTNAVVTTIPLAGAAETGQADPALGRVFVNIEDKNSVQSIDVATHKVVASWPIAPAAGGTGMAIDTASHRIFVGGGDGHLVMMDDQTGKVVASIDTCTQSDATWFDPGTKLVFSSCRDGKLTVAHMDSPNALTVVQTITTAQGSKTMTLDPATHKLYVGGAKPMAAQPAAAAGGRAGRVQMDPESFHVFIFGMGK